MYMGDGVTHAMDLEHSQLVAAAAAERSGAAGGTIAAGGRGDGAQHGGGEHLRNASLCLDNRDIPGATKHILKIARSAERQRRDPQFRDVLGRLKGAISMLPMDQEEMGPKDMADMAFALGKLQMNDQVVHDLLGNVAELARRRVDRFSPNDMSNIIWGFASLSVRNEALMSVIAAEVVNKIAQFDQRQLSNTAWAFAKCGLWNQTLVDHIANECMRKIATFTAQALSHISWAMAQWGSRKDELMDVVARQAIQKMGDFQPASLAMTGWSFASLQRKNNELMDAISRRACEQIASFKTQDLAHLAWAFANLRIPNEVLFTMMAVEIQKHIRGTAPPELSNIAWAFSKNGFANEELMSAIAEESIRQLQHNRDGFKSAEVAMLTWAFAVAGQTHCPLMSHIGSQVARSIKKYSSPQLSHIAWAFGALALKHQALLESLSQHVRETLPQFKAQGLSNIAWAFAMVNYQDADLLRNIAPQLVEGVGELRPLALARSAWAYALLNVVCEELMDAIMKEAVQKINDFPLKALCKLVDATSICATPEAVKLRETLTQRTAVVRDEFLEVWKMPNDQVPATRPKLEEYRSRVQHLNVNDCGNIGTPILLSQLGITAPDRQFVRRGRQALREAHASAGGRPQTACTKDFAMAELEVQLADAGSEAALASGRGGLRKFQATSQARVEEVQKKCRKLGPLGLMVVELPGWSGRVDPAFSILVDVNNQLCSEYRDRTAEDWCLRVVGLVKIFSTVLPLVSTIGAMREFLTRFPNMRLEFVEQVGFALD